MMESTYIGAYWGDRPESSLQCAERLSQFMAGLAKVDSAFESWFRLGASKAAAKMPVSGDVDALAVLLEQGRSRDDRSGEIVEELGFSIGLWNRAEPMVGLAGTVGSFPRVAGLLNSIVLDFPPPDGEGRRLHSLDVAEAIFEAVVDAWQPEWAAWTTAGLRDAQASEPRVPVLGWLTYLRGEAVSELPRGFARRISNGTIIQVGQDFAGASESAIGVARQYLQRSGVLRPVSLPN